MMDDDDDASLWAVLQMLNTINKRTIILDSCVYLCLRDFIIHSTVIRVSFPIYIYFFFIASKSERCNVLNCH